MKKLFTLSISAVFLLATSTSCRRDSDPNNGDTTPIISVSGVALTPTSATMAVGDTLFLSAVVQPSDATNQNVDWSSNDANVATVNNNGVVIGGSSTGTATITVTTVDGNYTATTDIEVYERYQILPNFCNTRTPGWGNSLGVVSFHTNNEWAIEGNGITQIWSDAVTATACQKSAFSGGTVDSATGIHNFNADCRSNPNFPGDMFSWCAVVRFADQLCPGDWRVPTKQDFIDLDIALGGSGNNRSMNSSDIATQEFVAANYITRWGGAFGGFGHPDGLLWRLGIWGNYWTLQEYDSYNAFSLYYDARGLVYPQNWPTKFNGLTVRCVR